MENKFFNEIGIRLLIILFLFSCSKGNRIDLNFCEDSIQSKNNTVNLEIRNNSNENYIFCIPSSMYEKSFGGYSKLINFKLTDENGIEPKTNGPVYLDKLFPTEEEMDLQIERKRKDSLLWKKLLNEGLKIDYSWVEDYKIIKGNSIVINSNQKKKISKKIVFFKSQLEQSGTYYTFDKNKRYFIQIEMEFDSTKIKEHLTPIDLDSLRKNQIKIFHGKLKTEKIPLIID